jgi:hypothetical protein
MPPDAADVVGIPRLPRAASFLCFRVHFGRHGYVSAMSWQCPVITVLDSYLVLGLGAQTMKTLSSLENPDHSDVNHDSLRPGIMIILVWRHHIGQCRPQEVRTTF